MLLVWDSYTYEADRMTEAELATAREKDPSRYVLIGEDEEE